MSKFNKLIKKLCPNGIQYKRIWEVTAWDKKFQSVSKEKQKKILKYHHLFSKKLLTFIEETGDVKIITTYESDLWTTEKRASKYMSEGEIVCLPGGGNAIIQYHKGKFITGDNRIATSLDTKVLNNKFLYYVLKNRLDEISTFYRGSGIKHPYMPKILDMLIPIPPIEIQEEIVRILDSFTQLTAELTARNKQYEYYRNKLLTFDELEGGGSKSK